MRGAAAFLYLVLAAVMAPTTALVVNAPVRAASIPATRAAAVTMGPAKEGPFSPAVRFAKLVLGEPTLLKVRGKAISYHSQYINEFCADFGVPKKMNQALIKKAKVVGSDLGFLS